MNYLLVMPKNAAKSSGGYNVFPVGIAYVAACLKRDNYNTFTANLEFYKETTHEVLRSLIECNNIDVICTSGLSRDYYKLKEIINIARQIHPDIVSIVGGGIISADPEPAMLALDADIGVIGEGEIVICELAHALNSNKDLSDVKGIIFKNSKGELTLTGNRSDTVDIDNIPFPDYDGFNFSEYMRSIYYQTVYLSASRSCPFTCTFCFHPSGEKYRQRTLGSLFDELDYLVSNYNTKRLIISDELFATSRSRVIEFCERISKYNLQWSLQLRVCDVDPELLKIMKVAGCISISYGLESADNSVLKSMKKHITVEQIEHALDLTYNANIDIQGGFIFGDAAETNETAANTLLWNSAHMHYGLELNMINIFPGTELYNLAYTRGIILDKVQYLKDGCPLINVSHLTDKAFIGLSSVVYEKNLRAKYEPEVYSLVEVGHCNKYVIKFICNRCGFESTVDSDALHITRTVCNKCLQRYFIDPFDKLSNENNLFGNLLKIHGKIALWGAGEICIKLMDKYPALADEHFFVVDRSKSRQGYSVCGKTIHAPEIIADNKIDTVLICVVDRKSEVISVLESNFPEVTNILIPIVDLNSSFGVIPVSEVDSRI